jgi:hypothetical protein
VLSAHIPGDRVSGLSGQWGQCHFLRPEP